MSHLIKLKKKSSREKHLQCKCPKDTCAGYGLETGRRPGGLGMVGGKIRVLIRADRDFSFYLD